MRASLLAVALCATATSVSATEIDDPFVKEQALLRLDGLDLATVDGQKRLAIRMDAAARAVCGDRLASVHLATAASARECQASVKANIRDQIEARMAAKGTPVRLASAR